MEDLLFIFFVFYPDEELHYEHLLNISAPFAAKTALTHSIMDSSRFPRFAVMSHKVVKAGPLSPNTQRIKTFLPSTSYTLSIGLTYVEFGGQVKTKDCCCVP